MQVQGEIQGLKANQLRALERTYRRRVPPDQVASDELLRHLLDLSQDINRRIGVLIDRRGHIEKVCVGSASRVYLPDLGRVRGGRARLRGVRWLQTQLRGSGLHQDDLADLQKLRLDYVLNAALGRGGDFTLAGAHLLPPAGPDRPWYAAQEARRPEDLGLGDFERFVAELETEYTAGHSRAFGAGGRNRAVLVSVGTGARSQTQARQRELRELCDTAGIEVADEVTQMRAELDPRYMVGKGKLEEIVLGALKLDAELLVFDRELTPGQVRTIADATELKVIDRTQLILDIFAQHAKTTDGKLQVELAQLKYNLPRLSEMSTAMSRLTGGIGGRGPGETKLEINRRRARDRINDLEKQIDRVSLQRHNRRRLRGKHGLPVISIVGYTNAGKSTLLNALTGSSVLVEDKLFATLDPTSRRVRFPTEREVVVTDTVGFIRELPEDLVNAFRATLEELGEADLLLHVIDLSDPEREEKEAAVTQVLRAMDLGELLVLKVWNKADLAQPFDVLKLRQAGELVVSAARRQGLDALMPQLESALARAGGERAK